MSTSYDAVVIGAGLDGLVSAAYLAGAGLRVLVLERREHVGGRVVTEEVFAGFKFDIAHRVAPLHPAIVKGLKLGQDGFELVSADPTAFAPLRDGKGLSLWRDPRRSAEAIRPFSKKDAERWAAFSRRITGAARFVEAICSTIPPDVHGGGPADLWAMLRLGARLRRLGRREMMEVLRILSMSVAELLDEWFEADVLRGTIGALGVSGILQGPMAAGTAYVLVHHHVGNGGAIRASRFVRGGVGKLAQALADAARARGVEIRTNAEVQRVLVEEGRARGVVIEGGDEISASRVVSSADPYRTFLDLLDPVHLDPEFVRKVRNIRFRGACAKVHLALGELPKFVAAPDDGSHLQGVISVSPSLEYLERAYDDAKYGGISREPYLEAVIPSIHDPTLAPAGRHVMSVLVQYAPYTLKEGEWDDARREALGDAVVRTLSRYAPNLESALLHRQVLTPRDLEETYGLREGSLYQGELTLDQLFFMRPVPGWSRYRTPIEALYLCGAGTHPAAGLSGASGYYAARAVLRDSRAPG